MPAKFNSGRDVLKVTLSDTGTRITIRTRLGTEYDVAPYELSQMELTKACKQLFPSNQYPGRTWPWYKTAEMVYALESGTCPAPRNQQMRDPSKPATDAQRNYIRGLAKKAEVEANPVSTMGEAHAEIERLKGLLGEESEPSESETPTPRVDPLPAPSYPTDRYDHSKLERDIESALTRITALTHVISDMRPQVHEIHVPDKPKVEIEGRQHPMFSELLEMIGAGVNVYLIGPPGTGKSFMVESGAKAMGIPFSYDACAPDMDSTALFGYRDGSGTYHKTTYFRAYTDGGWHNLDEGDKLNGAIATGLNNGIANGSSSFGGSMFKRHADNIITICANTYGTGGTKAHIHSLPLDPATLNRFTYLFIDYDEALENEITYAIYDGPETETWLRMVRTYRRNAQSENFTKLPFTYRNSMDGAKLLRIGWDIDRVRSRRLDAGLSTDEVSKLSAGFVR